MAWGAATLARQLLRALGGLPVAYTAVDVSSGARKTLAGIEGAAAFYRAEGAEVIDLGIVPDRIEAGTYLTAGAIDDRRRDADEDFGGTGRGIALAPDAQCATSSGSSYHLTLSPTLARSFHFRVFGASLQASKRAIAFCTRVLAKAWSSSRSVVSGGAGRST